VIDRGGTYVALKSTGAAALSMQSALPNQTTLPRVSVTGPQHKGTGMTANRKLLLFSASALAGLTLAGDLAMAQTRLREAAPPLTIQRRSFLDPGPVAPVGSRSRYVQAITTLAVPVYAELGVPGRFGYETLPRRFDPPGRPQPIFEFSTGMGGY
jgi:hypothetical protein